MSAWVTESIQHYGLYHGHRNELQFLQCNWAVNVHICHCESNHPNQVVCIFLCNINQTKYARVLCGDEQMVHSQTQVSHIWHNLVFYPTKLLVMGMINWATEHLINYAVIKIY